MKNDVKLLNEQKYLLQYDPRTFISGRAEHPSSATEDADETLDSKQ